MGFGLNTFKWHEYYTKKVKVVTFQPQNVIFYEFQRNNNGCNLVPRVSHLTTWSGQMRDPGNEVAMAEAFVSCL